MGTRIPFKVIEWIPYNRIKNIKFLTKGGYSEIYTAVWIDGSCDKWDSKKQQFKRFGRVNVILKTLGNVESKNQRWFEEAKSHLTISNKRPSIVQCYGLTRNTSNGNYMLVIRKMDMDLRKYLQQNHNQLTWKERIQITYEIIFALNDIHIENAIHRDLHSKNILHSHYVQRFYISDFGFCGPANRPSKNTNSTLYTSKLHQFETLPEPRNATEEELEAFHSTPYDFEIPDNIEDFNKSSINTFKNSFNVFNIEKLQSMMSKLTKK
ncbi:kinase-like protein [Rhizophagus irregularis]|uniref:Kinase-like protein n=1 Tax=Rhizophagus irregularis TaxID=588596 RepID=A0A2N0QT79_9GLOM|nr:kinase-like protein [Rhizophagus irregularis]